MDLSVANATEAFEMVLSPGAGRTSAAGGKAPRRVPDWQVEPVPPGACPGDARGEAPCIRKLKSPPSPEGKGGRGMGAESKTKGKVGRRPTGHAPRRHHSGRGYKCRKRFNAGGAGGRSPRRNKLKISPFPGGEERSASAGRGDILPLRGRGARKQAKGRIGGRQRRQAPRGHHSGRSYKCRTPCRLHLTFADRAPYTCRRRHPRRNRSAWSGGAGRQSCPGVRRARAPH